VAEVGNVFIGSEFIEHGLDERFEGVIWRKEGTWIEVALEYFGWKGITSDFWVDGPIDTENVEVGEGGDFLVRVMDTFEEENDRDILFGNFLFHFGADLFDITETKFTK